MMDETLVEFACTVIQHEFESDDKNMKFVSLFEKREHVNPLTIWFFFSVGARRLFDSSLGMNI